MIKKIFTFLAPAAVLLFSASAAQATTTLTSSINADNMFIEYLSPSPNSLVGATMVQEQITSGGSVNPGWQRTYSAQAQVTGSTEYLIVEVMNVGGPGGLLADFSLSGTGYTFSNGTQNLSTDIADWRQSVGSVSSTYSAPTNEGLNGVGPWGKISGISTGAEWIWSYYSNNSSDYNTVYFETKISSSAVPEPATITMLSVGLLGLAATRRKAV